MQDNIPDNQAIEEVERFPEQDYLEMVVRGIVSHPGEVRTERVSDGHGGVLIQLFVSLSDQQRLGGPKNLEAKAVRRLLRYMFRLTYSRKPQIDFVLGDPYKPLIDCDQGLAELVAKIEVIARKMVPHSDFIKVESHRQESSVWVTLFLHPNDISFVAKKIGEKRKKRSGKKRGHGLTRFKASPIRLALDEYRRLARTRLIFKIAPVRIMVRGMTSQSLITTATPLSELKFPVDILATLTRIGHTTAGDVTKRSYHGLMKEAKLSSEQMQALELHLHGLGLYLVKRRAKFTPAEPNQLPALPS